MYQKHKVLVEILSIDKNDLWDIRQSIILPVREILRSHRAYNSWLQSRLARPIELDAEIQDDYSRDIVQEMLRERRSMEDSE